MSKSNPTIHIYHELVEIIFKNESWFNIRNFFNTIHKIKRLKDDFSPLSQ